MRARTPGGAATFCQWGVLAALVCAVSAALGCTAPRCQGERCKRATQQADAAVSLLMTDSSIRTVTEADAACATQSIRAEPGKRRPVDIIFVIDNSGSMTEEIAAVRRNIDHDFASIIEDSGVDYRVIMLSLFGEGGTEVCIDPPLAGAQCDKGLSATNGPRYFHYNQEIGSYDALCQILDSFDRPQAPRAPHGFQDWLRPQAAKAFVLITDDSARCTYRDDQIQLLVGADGADPFDDALAFHAALRTKSPEQFGGHYQFFSIVGMSANDSDPQPLFPYQPLDPTTCSTAPTPGLSYQALSIATDALRYPVCEGRSFDAVFQVIARSVIQTASAECTFQLPLNPTKTLDLGSVNLEVKATPNAASQRFDQVKDASECKDDHSFYVHDRIELCPSACRVVQGASQPVVNILYGCGFALN
jgi:hypothetical protein